MINLITQKRARIKSRPASPASILVTCPKGTMITRLQRKKRWSKVRAINMKSGSVTQGWVKSSALREPTNCEVDTYGEILGNLIDKLVA